MKCPYRTITTLATSKNSSLDESSKMIKVNTLNEGISYTKTQEFADCIESECACCVLDCVLNGKPVYKCGRLN